MSLELLGSLLGAAPDARVDRGAWDALTDLAIRERVAPLLSQRLEARNDVPDLARQKLRAELYHTGAFNIVLYRELARLLEDAPGRVVVLKGAALASSIYDDPALRPMCDIDVLVRREDLALWTSHVTDLGYERASPEMARGLSKAVHYHVAFRGGPHGETVIELHWSLIAGDSDWRTPDIDWFWSQTEPWHPPEASAGHEALQLTPAARLLYLSAHAMLQHGSAATRLLWLYDIHRVVEQGVARLSWPEIVSRARTLEWDSAVAEALERAEGLFRTPVPPGMSEALRTSAAARSRAHVAEKADSRTRRAELVLRELECLDWFGRIRLCLAIVFPSPTYLKWRYPKTGRLWPLAYFYRWSVVAARAVSLLKRPKAPSAC